MKLQLPIVEPETDKDGHHCDADGGEELQRQRRQEGNAEHLHGALAVILRDSGDDRRLGTTGVEELQRRQALDGVEDMGAHPRQLAPLALVQSLRPLADEDHEQRDQRRREHHDQPGDPVRRHDEDENGERNAG